MKNITKDGVGLVMLDIDETISDPSNQLKDIDFVLQHGCMWKVNKNDLFCSLSRLDGEKQTKILEDHFNLKEYLESKYRCYLLEEKWKEFEFTKDQMLYVMKYFQDIYNKYKVEAAVVLMLNVELKKWEILFVPQVDCGHASVNYLLPKPITAVFPDKQKRLYEAVFEDKQAEALMEKACEEFNRLLNSGYTVYGTIHSHCDFAAFHSGVDDADETNFDGIHITIGNVLSGWTFSSRVMISGAEYDRDFNDLFNFTEEDLKNTDVSNIQIDEYHLDLMMPNLGSSTVRYFAHHNSSKNDNRFDFMSDWKGQASAWDSDNGYGGGWWNNDHGSIGSNDSLADDDEEDEHVFDEDEMVIIFNKEKKIYQYVTYVYYLNNREKFPVNAFDRCDAKFFHRQTEEKRSKREKKESKKQLFLLKDTRLNSSEKSSPFLVSDHAFSKNLKRKAKRKGR